MFKDFELPFVPTLVVGFALLLSVVAVIHECTSNPWDANEDLRAEGCEFVDGTLFAPDGQPSDEALTAARRLARQVGIEGFAVKEKRIMESP